MKALFRRYPHEWILVGLLTGLLLAAWRLDPPFVSVGTQAELSTHIWEMALLTVPMTLIIITAGIDLSVGATMALCAVVLGMTFERGTPVAVASLLAILTGTACGFLNGVFVAKVRVHPLIVTLATMSAYRGIAEGLSLAKPVSGFPASFAFIGRGEWHGISVPGLIVALAMLAAWVVLNRSVLGRFLFAIGHNETASRFSGVPVDRIKLLLYSLAGTSAGLAAVMFVSRRNTAKADIATGMELDVVTAVVLGGASLFGGRGRIVGTLLGVLLIHETREYVSWRWQNDELILVVIGALLIVSVLVNTLLTRRQAVS